MSRDFRGIKLMKHYLSHGGGVNSTALMLLLEREGGEFEGVFVDHGGDYPETYDYIRYLQEHGHKIIILKPNVNGCPTIEDYCIKYKILPSIWVRWCTEKFKITPLTKYFEKPCVCFVGIDAGERKRVIKAYRQRAGKGVKIKYPLLERGITREECKRIITDAGLKVPRRSGCWLCPYMNHKEVRKLYVKYPDFYARRKHLEEINPRGYRFDRNGISMSSIVGEDTRRLDEFCKTGRAKL